MSIDAATVLDTAEIIIDSFLVGLLIITVLWLAATAIMLTVNNPVGLLALCVLLLGPTVLGYMTLTLSGWL